MDKELKGIELLLTMTPKEISEYFAADESYHLEYTEKGELIGITTTNNISRLYYGVRDKAVLTRTIYVWDEDKWKVESKVSG